MDITGEDVPDTGLILEQGDGDIKAWPIPKSLNVIHKSNPSRGELFMTMSDIDGNKLDIDPRNVLETKINSFKKDGIKLCGAFELEFFLVANELDQYGKLQPAKSIIGKKRSHRKTDVYSVDNLHGMLPLIDDIYDAANAAGIEAETIISEYAPGQYELTLKHQNDLLKAADDIIRLKRIVRSQSRAHGVTACFMAKPMEGTSGSGMHFHISMYDKKDKNIFSEKSKNNLNPNLLNALGGLTKTMGESMLIFAPNANSWRRLVLGSYAPVTPNWGLDNRSVAFRIPSSNSKNRRIEHRVSGVDANPYLVALTVISAMNYGIKNKIKAPDQTKGNAYEQKSKFKNNMPHDWSSAILAAKKSKFLKDTLGADLHRAFIAIKEMEYQKVASTVSELDIDLYLNAI
jgi:glutamine synthetase